MPCEASSIKWESLQDRKMWRSCSSCFPTVITAVPFPTRENNEPKFLWNYPASFQGHRVRIMLKNLHSRPPQVQPKRRNETFSQCVSKAKPGGIKSAWHGATSSLRMVSLRTLFIPLPHQAPMGNLYDPASYPQPFRTYPSSNQVTPNSQE